MEVARMFLCARCRCRVLVCPRCDHGQHYCGQCCSEAARRDSVRAAGARYQRSRRGRHRHAERQWRYRARRRGDDADKKVTHQASAIPSTPASLCVTPASRAEPSLTMPPLTASVVRCHFCARPVSAFVRQGWLRRGGAERRRC